MKKKKKPKPIKLQFIAHSFCGNSSFYLSVYVIHLGVFYILRSAAKAPIILKLLKLKAFSNGNFFPPNFSTEKNPAHAKGSS